MGGNKTTPQLVQLEADAFVLGMDLRHELLMLVLNLEYGSNQLLRSPAM